MLKNFCPLEMTKELANSVLHRVLRLGCVEPFGTRDCVSVLHGIERYTPIPEVSVSIVLVPTVCSSLLKVSCRHSA